jgi:nucleotide-binding universal stress UspA family protein
MFDKILVAVDGSEHSRKAASVAGEIARKFQSELVVLHVREDELTWVVDMVLETPAEASELVDGIVRELKDGGTSARGEVVRAPLAHTPRTILDVAKEEGAGLIVMGTRGLSDWERLLVGSVAHKVVHFAEIPVLLVR